MIGSIPATAVAHVLHFIEDQNLAGQPAETTLDEVDMQLRALLGEAGVETS